jgi:hypothetical protein
LPKNNNGRDARGLWSGGVEEYRHQTLVRQVDDGVEPALSPPGLGQADSVIFRRDPRTPDVELAGKRLDFPSNSPLGIW